MPYYRPIHQSFPIEVDYVKYEQAAASVLEGRLLVNAECAKRQGLPRGHVHHQYLYQSASGDNRLHLAKTFISNSGTYHLGIPYLEAFNPIQHTPTHMYLTVQNHAVAMGTSLRKVVFDVFHLHVHVHVNVYVHIHNKCTRTVKYCTY